MQNKYYITICARTLSEVEAHINAMRNYGTAPLVDYFHGDIWQSVDKVVEAYHMLAIDSTYIAFVELVDEVQDLDPATPRTQTTYQIPLLTDRVPPWYLSGRCFIVSPDIYRRCDGSEI